MPECDLYFLLLLTCLVGRERESMFSPKSKDKPYNPDRDEDSDDEDEDEEKPEIKLDVTKRKRRCKRDVRFMDQDGFTLEEVRKNVEEQKKYRIKKIQEKSIQVCIAMHIYLSHFNAFKGMKWYF